MKKSLLILMAIGLMIAACAPRAGAPIVGKWKLVSYGSVTSPSPAAPDVEATIAFDSDGKVSGNGGCNSFGGDYKVNDSQITFGSLASTLMACADPQMAEEGVFYQVLSGTVSFKIEGNRLTLINKDLILVFEATTER